MINLLPPAEKQRMKKEYKLRVFTVYFFFIGTALLIALVLLLPSYFLANVIEGDAKREVAILENSSESTEREEINAELLLIKERLRAITKVEDRTELYEVIDTIANVGGNSISISSISYSRGFDGEHSTLLLGGIALTRDGLLAFTKTLEENELFAEVNLPVSSLAQDQNIEFNIDVKGTF